MPFSIASYNLLADAYMNPAWYPRTPPEVMAPAHRWPALAERIARLGADVVCLQEVQHGSYRAIHARLTDLGYEGVFIRKGAGKPDGCATFVRTDGGGLGEVKAIHYADGRGTPDSGHLVLVVLVERERHPIAVANTHLKWHAPGAPPEQQWARRQIEEFLAARATFTPPPDAWVICGDFNVPAESDAVRLLKAAGFVDAYAAHPNAYTSNADAKVKRIDFIFHTRELAADPAPMPAIENETPLPSMAEPSDHLPVMATLRWEIV
jgi:endonuclease/exonuclease/phosphatase family metal-dependent hydrolase